MSFTGTVKSEISKKKYSKAEYIAELSAIFRNLLDISEYQEKIRITTENPVLARRIFELMKELYDIHARVTVRRGYNFSKNYIYILEIRRRKDFILEDLGIVKNQKLQNLPEAYLLDDENSMKAYLRGVFLAVGSINDPKTSRYHLEFVVNDSIYANFLKEKLNLYDLNSKVLKRENKYMVYIKEAEKISDFLRLIGASNAVLYYEEIRIFRNQKNNTNRLNNCEQANVDKMIETANHQIHDIQILEEAGLLDVMDEKLLDVCTYRKKYPEVSLQELSEIITLETGKKITKSGVHHRLKKISEMASNLSQK